MTRRRPGFDAGSEPPDFTAMVMSLAMRANCFAMRFQRANMVCLRTSKMRPIGGPRRSGELGVEEPEPAPLQPQPPLELFQPLLEIGVLPVLDHGPLLLFQP